MAQDKTNIERIAADAFLENGEVKPFSQQITEYALGDTRSGSELVFPKTAQEYGLPVDHSWFVTLKQSDLRKILVDHELSLGDARQMDVWLEQHPLVMESLSFPDALVVFADARDKYGHEIIMSLHVGIKAGQENFSLFIDRITSAYGKESASNLIANTARAGMKIFVNEKTQDWLLRTGVQFPEPATSPVYNEYTRKRVENLASITPEQAKHTSIQDSENLTKALVASGMAEDWEQISATEFRHALDDERDVVLSRHGDEYRTEYLDKTTGELTCQSASVHAEDAVRFAKQLVNGEKLTPSSVDHSSKADLSFLEEVLIAEMPKDLHGGIGIFEIKITTAGDESISESVFAIYDCKARPLTDEPERRGVDLYERDWEVVSSALHESLASHGVSADLAVIDWLEAVEISELPYTIPGITNNSSAFKDLKEKLVNSSDSTLIKRAETVEELSERGREKAAEHNRKLKGSHAPNLGKRIR